MRRKIDLHIILLLIISIAVFLIKFVIIYNINYVGHADASGYAEMADSLIHGRGFTADYISFYFLKYDPKITRPEDHWPPLYSITIAPFFLIFGKTAFAAKLPSLIISCFLLPLALYSLAKELSSSKFAGLSAGAGILFYPVIFRDSLYCLSDGIYTFVICATALFAVKALEDGKYFYPLGLFMGLAYYAKGSGLIPIPGYIIFFIIAHRSIRKVFSDRRFLYSLLIAFLVLLPWFIRNYVHFRDPFFTTQRFSAGYIGYESWETGTYDLYWGEKPPPRYSDKLKEKLIFSIKPEYQDDLNNRTISDSLRQEFQNAGNPLSKEAAVSVKKVSRKWLITDNEQTYVIRKDPDSLSVNTWGIHYVIRMTGEYLKRYFWWTIMDINQNWGKFSKTAFLTYLINIPAVLGLFLFWGNKKKHIIWIVSSSLIFFLSAGWEPIYRLALPMTALMMPLGWATYFLIAKMFIRILARGIKMGKRENGKTGKRGNAEHGKYGFASFEERNLGRKWREARAYPKRWFSFVKPKLGINVLAGLMVCCVALPVIIVSGENVGKAIKESGYPYREADQEWMDMGIWLRLNAPPDTITMTRNPWELHFYSNQPAIQIPRTSLEKTIEVMRYYKPTYIIPQLDIRPSLTPLVEGQAPGLELVYDNRKLKLYKINYDLL